MFDESKLPPEPKPRIYWTDEESEKVTTLTTAMRLNNVTDSIVTLIKRAQEQLPVERRRPTLSAVICSNMIREIEKRVADIQEQAYQASRLRDELRSVKENEKQSEPTDEELLRLYGTKVLEQLTPEDAVSQFGTEALLSAIPDDQLLGIVVQRLYRVFSDVSLREPTTVPRPLHIEESKRAYTETSIVTSKPRLPRVVVIGPKENQQTLIQEACGNAANLWFSDGGDKPIPSSCDIIVFWTRFSSHSRYKQTKTLVPPQWYKHCNGGLNDVIATVRQTVVQWHES